MRDAVSRNRWITCPTVTFVPSGKMNDAVARLDGQNLQKGPASRTGSFSAETKRRYP